MTTVRNGLLLIIAVALLGVFIYKGHGIGGTTANDGVRVSFTVTVTDFDPGSEVPRVHYRTDNVMPPQPVQLSGDAGIPVDKDGHYRKSLGVVKRGTYIMVWVTDPVQLHHRPNIECKLYFDGAMVDQDDNKNDTVVVCEREVV